MVTFFCLAKMVKYIQTKLLVWFSHVFIISFKTLNVQSKYTKIENQWKIHKGTMMKGNDVDKRIPN